MHTAIPTTTPLRWRSTAIALALGLALIGLGARLVHPDPAHAPRRPAIAFTAPDFICHAPPGAWCERGDWAGLDRAPLRPDVK